MNSWHLDLIRGAYRTQKMDNESFFLERGFPWPIEAR